MSVSPVFSRLRQDRSWSKRGLVAGLAMVAAFAGCSSSDDEGSLKRRKGDPGVAPSLEGAIDASDPVATTRFARLSHRQYDNAVRWLLGLDVHPSREFVADPGTGGYDNDVNGLVIADRSGRDYRRAAEELAKQFVGSRTSLDALAPCTTPATTACGPGFVERFGMRAFRRPLSEDERAQFLALYESGKSFFPDQSAHAAGVQVVVETLLQSPNFLYRVELDDTPAEGRFSHPSSYEMASRLSFALWEAPPDDELLAAAGRGELSSPKAVGERAEKMVDDPRARAMIKDFHSQWFETEKYLNISRDQKAYPKFDATMGPLLQEEVDRFVADVIFEQRGGVKALLTSPTTFVNDRLAPLYGLQGGFGKEFRKVDLDPKKRPGLLTRTGFLAANAQASSSSPILRGVTILRKVLCLKLAPPPPEGSMAALPAFTETIRTTRDQVTELTKSTGCKTCHHTLINPVGFAFEHFDAVGQWRDEDRDNPVDSSGTLKGLATGPLTFEGAEDFIATIAASNEARRCYSKNMLRFAYGRADADNDKATLDLLTKNLGEAGYAIRSLIINLTKTRSFSLRLTEDGQ